MDLRADISLILCCVLQVAFGQGFEALLRSLGGFSPDGGNQMYQGLSGGNRGFSGGGGGGGGSSCPYVPHADKLKFTQRVNGQTFVRTCAPGTMYDAQTCGCVNIPKSASAGQRIGSPIGPGSNNMGMINDLVKQMQNRAMRPPTPSRAPTPPVSRPLKPQSRSTTNHMDTLRQLTSDPPQPVQPGAMSLDFMNMQSTGAVNPIKYPPDPDPFMAQTQDSFMAQMHDPFMTQTHDPFMAQMHDPFTSQTHDPFTSQTHDPFMSQTHDPFMTQFQDFSTGSAGSVHSPTNDILSMFQDTVLPQYRSQNFANPPTSFDVNVKVPSVPAKVTSTSSTSNAKPQMTVGGVPIRFATITPKQVKTKRRPPTNGIPLYKKVPKLANPDTDPLADLLMELSRLPSQTQKPIQTFNTRTGIAGLKSLPGTSGLESLLGRGGAMGGANAAALLGALGGGSMGGVMGGTGGGGGTDMSALLAALGGGGGAPTLGGNAASLLGLAGRGSSSSPSTMDMTSLFNLQGRTNPVGLAGLSGVNMIRLQELDRQGVVDLSDLSPEGAIAASRHFQG